MALTDTRIKNSKPKAKAYKLADAHGLYVDVRPTGAKIFRYRYRVDGRENVYTIGDYSPGAPDHVSLDEARTRRVAARALVRSNIHPLAKDDEKRAEERARSANTVKGAALQWLDGKRNWSDGYANQVRRSLEAYVYPTIGDRPLRAVNGSQAWQVLKPIADRGHATIAINVRQWCGAIWSDAMLDNRVDNNPWLAMRGKIERPDVQHKKPLPKDGIRTFRETIAAAGIEPKTRLALEILLYTFVRPGEVCRGEWSEIDFERATWTLEAWKMKKKERHLVPLSKQALALFRELHAITGGGRWMLPNQLDPSRHMIPNSLNAALRRHGFAGRFSAHGARATASTELHQLNYRSELIEFQLAHKDRDTTRASYNQAQYWEERCAMMQHWADMIDAWTTGANVVPIRAA